MTTSIERLKKKQKAAVAAIKKKNQEESQAKKDSTVKKRARTVEISIRLEARKQARRDRARKFNQFTSKPIVWIFAIVGWGHALYYLFQLVVLILRSMGIM